MKPSKALPGLTPQDDDEPLTKTVLAARAVRAAILRGDIRQGESLSVTILAARLGMSPTPVREAVRTLQAEGLIMQTPHHTLSVIKLSAKDVQDIFVIRQQLEPLATRLAVPHLTQDDYATLAELNAAMRAAEEQQHLETRHALNTQWHFLIYERSRNRVLFDTITTFWRKALWYTTWIMPAHAGPSFAQHEELLVALQAHDAERAARLMAEHLSNGLQHALDYVQALETDANAAQA